MDEKQTFKTYIRKDHRLGKNKYVLGMISGILHAICCRDEDIRPGMGSTKEYYIIPVTCTKDQYMEFTRVVGPLYGDLCTFQIN